MCRSLEEQNEVKTAVVTGANGFVGCGLVEELLRLGYRVYAVVRDKQSDLSRIPQDENVRILFCALSKMSTLPEILKDHTADLFFHFAWEGVSGIQRGNYELQLENVEATCEAVRAAAALKCKRFIFAGSIMEYEATQYLPQSGVQPGLGYIYSTAKLAADFMAKTLAVHGNIEYINCLISNIYGAGERSERFIFTTIKKMLCHQKLQFSSGEQYYDFIYISDAVKAIALAGLQGKSNTEYYIGNERRHKLKEFIFLMKETIDPAAQLCMGEIPYKESFMDQCGIDFGRLQREFGFKQEVSFTQGLLRTKEWIMNLEGDHGIYI